MKRKGTVCKLCGAGVHPDRQCVHLVEDPHAGVIDRRALQAVEKARSQRNGRMVAASSALAEYKQSRDSVPIHPEDEQGMHGGFWDFEQERRMGPRRGPPRPPRDDAAAMAAYVEQHGTRLSSGELDVYMLFWLRRLSYKELADEVGWTDERGPARARERAYQAVKRLRVKMHGARRVSP